MLHALFNRNKSLLKELVRDDLFSPEKEIIQVEPFDTYYQVKKSYKLNKKVVEYRRYFDSKDETSKAYEIFILLQLYHGFIDSSAKSNPYNNNIVSTQEAIERVLGRNITGLDLTNQKGQIPIFFSLQSTLNDLAIYSQERYFNLRRAKPCEAVTYLGVLSRLYFEAGTGCYQQATSANEIKEFLKLAGEFALRVLEDRSEPTKEDNNSRNYFDMIQRILPLIACWCETPARKRLALIPESSYYIDWKYFVPGAFEQPSNNINKYEMTYLRLAKELLTEGRIKDISSLQFAIGEVEHTVGNKIPKGAGIDALSALQCLKAIMNRNEKDFVVALEKLDKGHMNSARKGHYKSMNEGLINMNGMFLCKMALENDLSFKVDSPYVPLHLLN